MGGHSRGGASGSTALPSGTSSGGTSARSSRVTGGGRQAPRIDAASVRVIAETVPSAVGGGPLRDDVAAAVAADAETALRAVATRARSFMRAGCRTSLTTADIAAALRLRGGGMVKGLVGPQHARGFEVRAKIAQAGFNVSPLRFEGVQGAPGLFVVPDPVVSLREALREDIPVKSGEPELKVKWLAMNGMLVSDAPESLAELAVVEPVLVGGVSKRGTSRGVSTVSKRPRVYAGDADALFTKVKSVISAVLKADDLLDVELSDCLNAVTATPAIHALAPGLLSHFHTLVAGNANEGGNTPRLIAATRMLHAMAVNRHHGFEALMDNALPPLLTVVAGRVLGDGDQLFLRRTAADVLAHVVHMYGTPLRRARIAKTCIAVLTGDESELRAVHGAILGLCALGPDAVRTGLLPHIPALLDGLGHLGTTIDEAENATSPAESPIDGDDESAEAMARDVSLVAGTRSDMNALVVEVQTAARMCDFDDERSERPSEAGGCMLDVML